MTNIVRKLSDDGLIILQKRPQPNGRPGLNEFALRAQGAFSVGVRLTSGYGETVLVDLGGSIWKRHAFDVDGSISELVIKSVKALVEDIPKGSLFSGVGIGLEPTLPFESAELEAELAPMRVVVEDDCATAVLSERLLGAGPVEGGLMYVLIGENVRAGLLLRDKPYAGVHGRAGQIGQMRTGSDHASLDEAAGLPGLRSAIGEAQFFAIAAGGQLEVSPALRGWIQKAARHLFDAIVATAGFLAPGMVLVGGDLPSRINDLLVEQILQLGKEYATRPYFSPWMPEIRSASFANAGISVGAALLPFFATLLPSPFHSDPIIKS